MVIINADDFGYSKSVNKAICECFDRKIINRTTIMTTATAYQEAVQLSKANGFADRVGLHLVLDEGIPLTEPIKQNPHFCKDNTFINGCLFPLKRRLYLSHFDKFCLETEINAQIETYLNSGFTLRHIDSHHLVHTSSPIIFNLIKDCAQRTEFKSMRNVSIYSHDNLCVKQIKKYISSIIRENFNTTERFAAFNNYVDKYDNIEYMVHPDIVDNILVDVINRKENKYKKIVI